MGCFGAVDEMGLLNFLISELYELAVKLLSELNSDDFKPFDRDKIGELIMLNRDVTSLLNLKFSNDWLGPKCCSSDLLKKTMLIEQLLILIEKEWSISRRCNTEGTIGDIIGVINTIHLKAQSIYFR